MPDINIIDVSYGTKEVISAELSALGGSYSVLVLARPPAYLDVLKAFAELLLNAEGLSAVYVSINKPAAKVKEDFEKAGIKTAKVKFIDCIAKRKEQGVIFSSPSVIEINDTLAKLMGEKAKGTVLLLDSVSALTLYNTQQDTERFIHDLAAKAYSLRCKTVVFAVLTDQNKSFLEALAPVFDKSVRITR